MWLFTSYFRPYVRTLFRAVVLVFANCAALALADFEIEEQSVREVASIVFDWSERWRLQAADSSLAYQSWLSGISTADIEMFMRLSTIFTPRRILIVGGGPVTLALSHIFGTACLDVLDTGAVGQLGVSLTRFVAAFAKKNISIFTGSSPKDTHQALQSKNASLGQQYQLVIVGGNARRGPRRFFQDFAGIYPHLAKYSVVVGLNHLLHLRATVCSILCSFRDMRLVYYKTAHFAEQVRLSGTGFMYRGFADAAFAGLHGFKIPYRCGQPEDGRDSVIYMVPNLLPNTGNKVSISPRLTQHGSSRHILPNPEISQSNVLDVESTVLQWYFEVTGLRVLKDKGMLMRLGHLKTGYTITRSDVELFVRLKSVMSPQRIFIVGNAWGYSSLVLSHIFADCSVDVIDAGIEGVDNLEGIKITQSVAAWVKKDISVLHGFSPRDTPSALRWKHQGYELVFIDGDHNKEQMIADFIGIYPYLAQQAVVVLHDIAWKRELKAGVCTILCKFTEMRFVSYPGVNFPELARFTGTGFMYRGFQDDVFAGFYGLGGNLEFGLPKADVVWMIPELQPSCPTDLL